MYPIVLVLEKETIGNIISKKNSVLFQYFLLSGCDKRNPELLKLCVDLDCIREASKYIFLPGYNVRNAVHLLSL